MSNDIPLATPGAILATEDSVNLKAESSGPRGLQEWEAMFAAWARRKIPGGEKLWPNPNWSQDVAMVAHALQSADDTQDILKRANEARDAYRDDYYRAHSNYMDFKYPSKRVAQMGPGKITDDIKAHAEALQSLVNMLGRDSPVHPDPTGKTREPLHCPTCGYGLEGNQKV